MNSESPAVPEVIKPTIRGFSFLSLISALTGILSYLMLFLHSVVNMSLLLAAILAPISALIAVFTGHRSKREIRRADGMMSGKKLANIGLILGYIYLIICLLIVVLAILGIGGIISGITKSLGL